MALSPVQPDFKFQQQHGKICYILKRRKKELHIPFNDSKKISNVEKKMKKETRMP